MRGALAVTATLRLRCQASHQDDGRSSVKTDRSMRLRVHELTHTVAISMPIRIFYSIQRYSSADIPARLAWQRTHFQVVSSASVTCIT